MQHVTKLRRTEGAASASTARARPAVPTHTWIGAAAQRHRQDNVQPGPYQVGENETTMQNEDVTARQMRRCFAHYLRSISPTATSDRRKNAKTHGARRLAVLLSCVLWCRSDQERRPCRPLRPTGDTERRARRRMMSVVLSLRSSFQPPTPPPPRTIYDRHDSNRHTVGKVPPPRELAARLLLSILLHVSLTKFVAEIQRR